MRTFRRGLVIRSCAMVALSAVLCGGCSLFNDEAKATSDLTNDKAIATWDLTKDQTADSDTTAFAVDVTRLGCNNGETGTVNDPDIEMTDTQVVITFTVSPSEPGAANCLGNDAVSYGVELPEALGERELVDGGCDATEAASTSTCQPSGVRYSP